MNNTKEREIRRDLIRNCRSIHKDIHWKKDLAVYQSILYTDTLEKIILDIYNAVENYYDDFKNGIDYNISEEVERGLIIAQDKILDKIEKIINKDNKK